jgi:hypothetical protein
MAIIKKWREYIIKIIIISISCSISLHEVKAGNCYIHSAPYTIHIYRLVG